MPQNKQSDRKMRKPSPNRIKAEEQYRRRRKGMKCLYKGNRDDDEQRRGMRFRGVTNESTIRQSKSSVNNPYMKSIPAARATTPTKPPPTVVLTAPDFLVCDALAAELEPVAEPELPVPPPAAVAATAAEPVSGLAFDEKGLVWLLLVST